MPAFTMFELKIRGLFVLEAMLVEADAWHEVLELNGVRDVAAARRAKEGLRLTETGGGGPINRGESGGTLGILLPTAAAIHNILKASICKYR